ncbi:MAG TPA: MDR family MFS transporter [Blastocatellia bacterium]|nr:MDR family MFS transporter [Blastocatellia bacterium]
MKQINKISDSPNVPAAKLDLPTKLTLLGVALGIFMGALESTIVGTAMPTVIATLGGIEIYSWVAVAYMLTSTVMTPIWGKMADLIGRRPAMFGGLALFILGSALSGAAHSMLQLIAFRALQGLGAAALFPVGMTIVADLLSLERRTRMIGLFSSMWGVASLFGPIVGGFLTQYWSWRWVFYINLPFGILAGVLIWFAYTEQHERRTNIKLDYAGTITLTMAMVVLLMIVERGNVYSTPVVIGGLLAFVALTLLFVWIECHSPEPLMPLNLFRNRMVTVTTLHGLFAGMMLFGAMLYLPLFVQAVMGRTPTEAGQILTPYILPWTFSSIIGTRLILRHGYRSVAVAGMVLMLIGSLIMAFVSTATTRMDLMIAVIFLGLSGGLTLATLMIGTQHSVARNQLGVVTSTVQFARNIGAALGIGLMGAVLSWSLRNQLSQGSSEVASLSLQHGDVAALIRQTTRTAISPEAAQFLQTALAGSLQKAFVLGLVAVAIGTVISLLIPGGKAHELAHAEHQENNVAADDEAALAEIETMH